mmetsp:Transcript_128627/g.274463  ORF Transcript_128627/g.274463 Transcript_128627/m.274463 type:complete len:1285 (-) Transcript_128627:164-4018(-)
MAAEGKQSFARRDLLQQIEVDVQKRWEELKVFETDAPSEESGKFFCTFPYPYMNGMLHIGHAFSLTKAVFAAHFNRLLGKKVLFPFGFHCTGMPIQAAANNLKKEYQLYGKKHPIFPAGRPAPKEDADGNILLDDEGVTLSWKSPPSTGNKAIKNHHVFLQVNGGDFKEVVVVPHPDPEVVKAQGKKVISKVPVDNGACVYKVRTELVDGSFCPDGKLSDEIQTEESKATKKAGGGAAPGGGKRVAKKILAKTGDAAFQFEILLAMGIKPEDMEPFADPLHWLKHFPPLGVRDLKRFGAPVDFRRSFITTSVNPYYDSFIRWQFAKLKAAEKIGFGKRPTIFSEVDGQACMDHDRSEGEGVVPQEYTAIKIEILELPPCMASLKGKKVYMLAATLRAETMPGQTNAWILPEGTYGCFKAEGGDAVYVSSHRAARNMSFQDILVPWGKPECLLEVTGKELLGAKVKAPTSKYDAVYVLPLLTIKMNKGTGIVTSVPSDSPDDYAAFMDLMKPGKREHFGIKAEWVEPFELIPIIDVEIDGEVRHMAAQYMCEKLNVQSQKDKEKLQEAHDVCYKLGFDKGTMSYGPCKGKPVKQAKLDFRAVMVKAGQAFVYHEPENKVVSRSGDECVVAGIDQWYLKYGEEGWRSQIQEHLQSPNFCTYNDRIKDSFMDAIGWLKEWACSRSFGLGTRVPWDEQFVIESLSDSTIYMAYYSVAHFLQGDLDGSKPSGYGIKPGDLSPEVWDFIMLEGPMPKGCKIPAKTLEQMRKEFRFWYPMDLRVSGKDLIQNHLTMCLYNHAAIWDKPELWPQSFFCNGWLLVNNEKMSKSKGNFFSLEDIINKYSADTVRLAMANSGDTLEPANFDETVANKTLLAFPVFLESMKALTSGADPLEQGPENKRFVDRWFANELNRLVVESKTHYEGMYYREALRTAYFEFTAAFDQYRDICKAGKILPNKVLVMRYLEWQLIILSPICPHFCEHGWGLLSKQGSVLDAGYPAPLQPVDISLVAQGKYMYDTVPHDFIKLLEKASKQGDAKAATVYVAKDFPDWKVAVLEQLRRKHAAGQLPLVSPEDMKQDETAKAQWKEIMTSLMQDAKLKPMAKHLGPFAAFKRDEAVTLGISALDATVPFDEKALLGENVEYLKDKLKMDVTVALVEELQSPDHKESASTAQPGKPAVHFLIEGGAGKAGGGKAPKATAGGDAKASGGAPQKGGGKAAGAAVAIISDLKKLDEHLSTRSYIEGGPTPTASDARQLTATPGNVDGEKFPHVARWRSHINFFPAERRAKW